MSECVTTSTCAWPVHVSQHVCHDCQARPPREVSWHFPAHLLYFVISLAWGFESKLHYKMTAGSPRNAISVKWVIMALTKDCISGVGGEVSPCRASWAWVLG